MKRDTAYSLFCSWGLSFSIAFGGILCLVTAFDLPANLFTLAFLCLMWGGLGSFLCTQRFGNWIFWGIWLFFAFLFWNSGILQISLEMLIYRISMIYDLGYGWGVAYWSPEPPAMASVTLALGFAIVPILWTGVYCVSRRQCAVGPIVTGLIPLLLCMVVTDSVPGLGGLFFLLMGILLLVLTQTVRRRNEAAGNRLTAILLLPVFLCSVLLFWAVPRDTYEPPETLPGWIGNLFSHFTGDSGNISGMPDLEVDLANTGPKFRATYVVMEVSSSQYDTLYLRGQSFDRYDGTSWTVSDQTGEDKYWPNVGWKEEHQVTVYLRQNQENQFLPYYSNELFQLKYGRLFKEMGAGSQYVMTRKVAGNMTRYIGAIQRDALVTQCLQLPDSTQQAAREILEEIGIHARHNDRTKARLIGNYVSGLAKYDINTQKMPENERDFALWFLTDAETGYCVHFATAATVLLRAAGVPARYVTGYLSVVGPGKVQILAEDSHAWVEYLDSDRGWTVLDPTPAQEEEEPTDPVRPTVGTDPTQATDPIQGGTQGSDPTQGTDISGNTVQTGSEQEGSGGADPLPKRDLTLLWNCLLAILLAGALGFAVWGQYRLRLKLRRRHLGRGRSNQRALALWREILYLGKHCELPLPAGLSELAEKAKFSQHTLTAEELKQFGTHFAALRHCLAGKKWYQKLVDKLIFAAE